MRQKDLKLIADARHLLSCGSLRVAQTLTVRFFSTASFGEDLDWAVLDDFAALSQVLMSFCEDLTFELDLLAFIEAASFFRLSRSVTLSAPSSRRSKVSSDASVISSSEWTMNSSSEVVGFSGSVGSSSSLSGLI